MKVYICFPGGKHKILTMSYDDGKLQDRRLVAVFNKYGIKGTFHLNSGLFEQDIRLKPEEITTLYTGHEIACHTLTHPTIARCPLSSVVNEIAQDRINLERILHRPVLGLSYPNGSYSREIEDMLPALGIKYSRIVGDSDSFDLPSNLYEWKATCHHNHNLLKLGEQFAALNKSQYLYMMYVWGHSYEFERDNNWELIETFCKLMGGREDIWYATNLEYVSYMEAARQLVYAYDLSFVYNPTATSIWIAINGKNYLEIPAGTQVDLSSFM